MSELCRLIVPVDVNEQNPNRRRKLRDWIRAKTAHKKAAWAVWVKAGKPKAQSAVTVSVVVRRGHMLDEDNARASLKAVFDGLFKKAITPDDSPQWVRLGTLTQEIDKRWKYAPEVEIVVREAR